MKVQSMQSNANFCATLKNANYYSKAKAKFENRESTDREILESYDEALKIVSNRSKLVFELDRIMQDSAIQKERMHACDWFSELCVFASLFSPTTCPHYFRFERPELYLYSESEPEWSKELRLSDEYDTDLKEKIRLWLLWNTCGAKRTTPLEVTFMSQDPQEVQEGCKNLSLEIVRRKYQQEELYDLMNNDKEICAILDEISDDIEIQIGRNCLIKQHGDYVVPSDVYPLSIFAKIPTGDNGSDCNEVDFSGFNEDGSVNREALIDWLNSLKDYDIE